MSASIDFPESARGRQNPLTARLVRRAGCLGGRVILISALLIGPLTSWLIIKGFSTDHDGGYLLSMLSIVYVALTTGGVLSLPLFAASTAARVTVGYACSQEYPLLCVTTLPDREIVNGYVRAILRYIRAPLALMLGLTPAFGMISPSFAWIFSIDYRRSGMWYDGTLVHIDMGMAATVLKHALVTIALGLGLLGANLLAIALGVSLGLWWRNAMLAVPGAMIATVGSTLLMTHITLRTAAILPVRDAFFRDLLQCGLFAPMPYVLAFGCMRLARRWARKPG